MAIFPSVGSRISFTVSIMVKTGTSGPAKIYIEEDNLSAALVWPGMFMAGIVSIVVIISLNVRNALPIVCSLSPRAAPVMVTHWPVTAHTPQVRWEDNQRPLKTVSKSFLLSTVIIRYETGGR